MAIVTIKGITVQFGTQVVLEDVSLDRHAGETVGLYGKNGSGKTTIFRLLAQECNPDFGTITRAKNLQIGYLTQDPQYTSTNTLHEEVGSVFDELLALETRLHDLSDQLSRNHDHPNLRRQPMACQ